MSYSMATVGRLVCLRVSRDLLRISKPEPVNRACFQPLALLSNAADKKEDKENEKPPQNLCKGINFLKDGQDPPLLPDSEYPDWLWTLASGKEAGTHKPDSLRHWRKINKTDRRQENETRKQQRK